MFKRIGIIGVGLIGGSIALDTRRFGLALKIIGYDANRDNLNKAYSIGIIDKVANSIDELLDCDLVVIAVPVSYVCDILEKLYFAGYDGLISDVGSIKGKIVKKALKLKLYNFIPAHPIAGTENFGPEAAKTGLFENAFCIITPFDGVDSETLSMVEKFYKSIGMRIVKLSADEHDRIFAFISHMPHAVAYELVELAASKGENFKFIGGGFRDFTRIAASSEEMWSDIFVMNKDNVVSAIDEFIKYMRSLRDLIEKGDKNTLKEKLGNIRRMKRELYG
ncbi:prephenate dehydrogenase [Hippea alviniae]|uniref:prephenate dehydrogenase n=1 Tax=Hippea alviniae TaxID=1279027 RepID=UPI0003B4D558|nr:prephenate dehydrogenase/arogenate dehydrogenase family protein [Hippea alviniae]